jgi:hypothetical protein
VIHVRGTAAGAEFLCDSVEAHPSCADAYSFIEEAGEWEYMGAKHTPVLATEEDSERYKKDIAILGLEDYPPQYR